VSIKKAPTNSSEPNVISTNPFRCRVWAERGRLEEWVTEKSCEAELKSIAAHGQITPVLVRRVTDDPSYDFELICGTRRLFVTRFLNLALKAQIRELSDREAVIALDVENRHRKDISPYERGTSYKRWLKLGHFKCQEELARALEISPSQVSRLLKLTQLPAVIVGGAESMLLGMVGGILGAVVALLLFDHKTLSTIGTAGQVIFQLRISPELIFLGTACACVLGLIGGLPPALRAGRQPIATALQGG
jgi:ParB/RepB/Spo0J family partition protein